MMFRHRLPTPVRTLEHSTRAIPFHIAFASWSRLAAWGGVSFIGVELALRFCTNDYRCSGHALPDRIHLTIGTDLADGFATLLHEMAHVAGDRLGLKERDHHGSKFRALFVRALVEVTGMDWIDPGPLTQPELDELAREIFAWRFAA